MQTKDAIRSTMNVSTFVLNSYISDLDDDDLLRRPGKGCNHLAWQLGHLINSEAQLVNSICPGKGATLPAGFAEQHSKETTQSNDKSKFHSKQKYQELFEHVRGATLAALDAIPEAELDGPSPEHFRQHFPTVGDIFVLIATHPMMHAGQFVVVRRELGKPVLI